MTKYGQIHHGNGLKAFLQEITQSFDISKTHFLEIQKSGQTVLGDFGDNLRTSGPKTLSNAAFDRKLNDESNAFSKISPR